MNNIYITTWKNLSPTENSPTYKYSAVECATWLYTFLFMVTIIKSRYYATL